MKVLKHKFIIFFKNIMHSGASPQKLATSFSVGVYIAFSPFPGLHAVMMFLASWLLKLNFPTLFFATSINNPWTIIPFYSTDYFFGYWFVHHVIAWYPNYYISMGKIFGCGKICIVSFLVGGNILGVMAALLSYPFVYILFKKLSKTGRAET